MQIVIVKILIGRMFHYIIEVNVLVANQIKYKKDKYCA